MIVYCHPIDVHYDLLTNTMTALVSDEGMEGKLMNRYPRLSGAYENGMRGGAKSVKSAPVNSFYIERTTVKKSIIFIIYVGLEFSPKALVTLFLYGYPTS